MDREERTDGRALDCKIPKFCNYFWNFWNEDFRFSVFKIQKKIGAKSCDHTS